MEKSVETRFDEYVGAKARGENPALSDEDLRAFAYEDLRRRRRAEDAERERKWNETHGGK